MIAPVARTDTLKFVQQPDNKRNLSKEEKKELEKVMLHDKRKQKIEKHVLNDEEYVKIAKTFPARTSHGIHLRRKGNHFEVESFWFAPPGSLHVRTGWLKNHHHYKVLPEDGDTFSFGERYYDNLKSASVTQKK
jgi:hypothetical protein